MDGKHKSIWTGAVLAYLEVLSHHLPGEIEENHEHRMNGNVAEIHIIHLSNTSPEVNTVPVCLV